MVCLVGVVCLVGASGGWSLLFNCTMTCSRGRDCTDWEHPGREGGREGGGGEGGGGKKRRGGRGGGGGELGELGGGRVE